jgi:translocation and assembly module TamB
VIGTPIALALDGHAAATALDDFSLDAAITGLDAAGAYHATVAYSPTAVDAALTADEPARGLAERVAGLPDLGPLALRATLRGPTDRVATRVSLTAGPLRLAANGQVDLTTPGATLDLTAMAPAMAPAPGVSFGSVDLAAHVAGTLAAPQADGHLTVTDLAAAGATIRRLSASLSGTLGKVAARAVAEGARLPGPRPDLIAADPVRASVTLTLSDPTKPVVFTLSHPLLAISGHGQLAPAPSLAAHVTAPDLAPFAAIGGVDARGRAALDVRVTQAPGPTIAVDGTIGVTAGPGPSAALIGDAARIGLTARLSPAPGQELTLSRLTLDGAALRLAATGHAALGAGGTLAAEATVTLPDLRALAPTLGGTLALRARADGTADDLALSADLDGDVATPGVPAGRVTARIAAAHLPAAPSGRLTAQGQLDGAPLDLDVTAARAADGATRVDIAHADWRSAHAEGALALAAGATLPTGRLALRMTRLDDLRRLTGLALTGGVSGTIDLARGLVTARILAERAGIPGTSVARATLEARVDDPLGAARVDARLVARGARAGATQADATVTVAGPRDALAIRADAHAAALLGGPASVATRAVLDLDRRTVALAALAATARGQTVRLLGPARVSFGDTVAVDRLRLGLRDAVLDISGRAAPTLDLTASLRNLRADLAAMVDPGLAADGVITADARLTGTPARPSGTVRLDATGLHLRQGPGRALPPLSVRASLALAGTRAQVDATLTGGGNRLTLTGTAPIDPAAPLDLRAAGGIDLAVLDPLLAGSGRRVAGRITIDAGATGTLAAPHPSGTVRLTGGDIQDFAQGIRLDQIDGVLSAAGDTVRIDRLSARARQGTISASGDLGVGGDMPVNLRITARKATPLASDLLTALLDADLTVTGTLRQRVDLGGGITVERADIRVPDRLPASIPLLHVVTPGARPPPPPGPPLVIGLDLHITAPGRIFIRGRGIDAELSGNLRLGGTSAQPVPRGGFTLRRGSFSIAGTTLTFTSGTVSFNGAGGIDPALDLVATSTTSNVTATLTITGTASDPTITLSSVPELPQDEVLAHLLFGQSAASLSPFQLAQIAAAVAQLTGVAGGGFDPLNAVRQGLGLDRLSVAGGGGGANGSAPNVEAGRYVAPGIYVGAKQATSGGGTQAEVQIDLMRGLKLETTVGTGGGSAQGAAQSGASSSGTGVGLTYQFQY